jgi:transcriptional regulator with XRE-family HTH domain
MYPNLNAELARKDIKLEQLARVLGLSVGTVSQKKNGLYDFTLKEAKAIKHFLQVDIPLEELFEEARC